MVKPTLSQIEEYMNEKGCFTEDEAELFYCHYDQVGWVVGKGRTPMQKWKSAVSGWLIRNKRRYQDAKKHNNNNSFADRQRQQANQARTEIQQAQLGLYPDNVRPLRSVG